MKTKIVTLVIICIIVLSGFLGLFNFGSNDISVKASTLYVGGSGGGNYSTIQSAINAAAIGDTVFVYSGTYNENLVINKKIELIGNNTNDTIIDGQGSGDVVQINAHDVAISGFTIRNSGTNIWDAGIDLNNVKNCLIQNNNITSNKRNGIYIYMGSNISLLYNNITSNKYSGIRLESTSFNNISNNKVNTNNVGNYFYYGGIVLDYSNNNTFIKNNITNNKKNGIITNASLDNKIINNDISNNPTGIYWGLMCIRNIHYFNDFINNTNHIMGNPNNNIWNSTQPMSYIYNKTNFTKYIGNYWDDYTGKDTNGDGIGDTAYSIGSTKDNFPLITPSENYNKIPSTIKLKLNTTSSNSTNKTVTILVKEAYLNAVIKGDFNGSINLTDLELVFINSSSFAGKGFFKSNWTATIEGKPYQGTWQGLLFKKPGESKICLKGTVFGGLQGITDGYLIESNKGSGIFNIYNSTWTICKVGNELTYAKLILNGTTTYLSSTDFFSDIHILQVSLKGNTTGYYNGSLSIVITHVRIENESSQYYGQGFSIITYISNYGTGQGWTYDNNNSKNIVKMTGFFTHPLIGIIFGELSEIGSSISLSISIIKIDAGLPPSAILDINVWGRRRISPGQTYNYFLEYINYGLKEAVDTEIIMILPNTTKYLSNTGGGVYNSSLHEIIWRRNISAKSKNLISTKCTLKGGLTQGLRIICNVSIHDYKKNITIVSDSHISAVLTARDPNVKYGFEGNVSPGQKLNYTIEYENEGQGIAFGVYFTDILSEYLNDSSLTIGPVISTNDSSIIAPEGSYNPGTRTITWFVGEVGPGEGGYANITVNVRDDATNGMEILNYGTVYFPSVPEITRTNGIVTRVWINQRPTAVAGSNLVVKTLQPIIFDGSGSSDIDGLISNYTWDFGDGDFGYGMVTLHSYSDDGNYSVILTVKDEWDEFDSHEIFIDVLNRAPNAVLDVDFEEINTQEPVVFNAGNSLDLDGNIIEYYIDFGDGSNSGWITSDSINHLYSDGPEVYTAVLTVKDDDDEISINYAMKNITVNNRLPIPVLEIAPLETYTYEDIKCDAVLSTDSDGVISSYFFDFGDGANSGWTTSSSITHQYEDGPKDYFIQLTIKDDDGETNTTVSMVTIRNRNPIADAGADQVIDTNILTNFNGESSSDMDGRIISYNWNFGDGSTGIGKSTTHSYSDDGQYTVTLTVTDDDSAIGKDSCIVNVDNVKPVAGFIVNPIEGTVATVFQFESTSYDTDGFVTKFYWDFGDGNTASEPNPTHQYSTRGTYKVSLLVQDDDGLNSDEFEIEIILSNQIPIAIAESSTNIAEVGENIEFDATRSYDPDGNIISYMWQLGDGTYANGQIIQHSFDKKGTYTITLTVTDDVNIPASTSFEVDIIEMFSDFDNDNLPDDIDLDDDNDGLPDIWEKKYGLNITDPSDANIDTDDDDLNNLEEYLHQTDPTNPDTDGEGLLDGEEIKIYHTNASNPDTDGDSYNDKIDAYPNNPNKHKLVEAYHEDEYKYNLQFIISIIIIILVAIIIIITIVIRKKRRALIGEPYIKNEILHDLSNNVLNDSDGQNLSLSRDNMLRTLETRYANGEVSEETYKYIRNEILYREYDLDNQADLIEK